MEYLTRDRPDWNFPAYLAYWDARSDETPASLRAIFTDTKLFYPQFRESLHDSWIGSVLITNHALADPPQPRVTPTRDVRLSLVGAYHDLIVSLNYEDVRSLRLGDHYDFAYGDLSIHEFTAHEGRYIHEMQFENGAISIDFLRVSVNIEHIAEIDGPPAGQDRS